MTRVTHATNVTGQKAEDTCGQCQWKSGGTAQDTRCHATDRDRCLTGIRSFFRVRFVAQDPSCRNELSLCPDPDVEWLGCRWLCALALRYCAPLAWSWPLVMSNGSNKQWGEWLFQRTRRIGLVLRLGVRSTGWEILFWEWRKWLDTEDAVYWCVC